MSCKPDVTEAAWKSWGMCRLLSPTAENSGHQERQNVRVLSNFDDNDVQQYCRNSNVAAHRVYQIAWAIVLGAYTGTEEITTGFFMVSRPHEPIVYRCRLHSMESATRLCTKVEEIVLEQVSAPEKSVAELGRASRLTGLFDTMLSICDTPSEGERCAPMQHLALCIKISRRDGSIILNFSRGALSESQAKSIGGCLDRTISQILQHGDKEIRELDIISAADMDQLAEWNQAKLHLAESCIHDVIQSQVSRRPQKPAICAWDGNFTYEQLDQRSNALAGRLRRLGVKKDVIVPFYFHKSAWTVVAILATLKAGGAAVALNADFPVDRLLYIIRFTGAKVITAEKDIPNSIRDAVAHVVIVDNLSTNSSESSESSETPTPPPSPQDTSFVVFTSGSTGVPKGIVIDHQSFCSSAMGQIKALNINQTSRVLQFSAHTFDVHLLEIVTSLMSGACVCIPSEEQRMNDLKGAINQMGVTWAGITPTVAQVLSADDVQTLKTLAVWGETSSKDIVDAWADRVELLNVWGPAECSVVSCVHNLSKHSRHPAILGKALPGNRVWIVRPDNWTKLAPLGSIGEAVVQGFTIGQGYLHNPARTKEVFVTLPWVTDQAHTSLKAYRSGDLVRHTENGEVQFLGRKDTQVKLRGQRIELEEVEFNINLDSSTNLISVVEVIEPGSLPTRQILASFQGPLAAMGGRVESQEELRVLSITEKMRVDLLDLKSRVSQRLPPYMVPDLYIPLEYIPTLASGKIDRRKIRRLAACLTKAQLAAFTLTSFSPAATEYSVSHLEERILNLVTRVLELDRNQISEADSFISLGGNSIRAMQLAATARREGLVLTVADIMHHRHLAALSRAAKAVNTEENKIRYEPFINIKEGPNGMTQLAQEIACNNLSIGTTDVEDIWPATDYQALHIGTGLAKGRGGTNFLTFDFEKPPPIELLESSCRSLAHHHATLRSVFVVHRRHLLQVVLRNFQPDIILHKCTESVQATTASIQDDDKRSRCGLGHPITRFMILHRENRAHRLVLKISHAQYDGVSFFRFCKDFEQLLQGYALTPAPNFGEYVLHSRQQRKESIAYWSKLLAGAEMTSVVRHQKPSYRNVLDGVVHEMITVDADLARSNITIASAIKASWSVVLAELSGRTDVVFGSTTWGRSTSLENMEHFVGTCINQIPVRVSFRPGMTVLELLEQVQEQYIASASHEASGFVTIVENCTYWRLWERLSSVVLYQNLGQEGSSFSIDRSRVNVTEIRPPADRCDIAIYSEPRGPQTFIEINFCEDIIPVTTARGILNRLCAVLVNFANDHHATLKLPRVSPLHSPQLPLKVDGYHGAWQPVNRNEDPAPRTQRPKRRWNESLRDTNADKEHKKKTAKLKVTRGIAEEMDNDAPRIGEQNDRNHSPGMNGGILTRHPVKENITCATLPCTVYYHVEKAWEIVMDCPRDSFAQHSLDDTPFYEIWGNAIAACGLAEYYNKNLGCQVCSEDIMECYTPRLQVNFLHQQCSFCDDYCE